MILSSIRYTTRTFLKTPGFTTVVILTLALGIGANAALFSVADALILRPLPFKDADHLVRVTGDLTKQGIKDVGLNIPELFDLRDRAGLFDEVSGLFPVNANLTQVDEPERIEVQLVSPGYFNLLGVTAQLGRVFGEQDYTPGITEVAVISDSLWKRRFGARPDALGKKVRLDEDMYTIIGVMPADFRHPGRSIQGEVDMWSPTGYVASPFNPKPARVGFPINGALGRLKPGISVAAAQAKLDALSASLRAENPGDYPEFRGWTLRLIPLHNDLYGNVRPALFVLLSAVGAVLLIACANVANLLLARAAVRQREFAIRTAIGASRKRIAVQMLMESITLSLLGGAVGLSFAVWSVDLLRSFVPANLPVGPVISINGNVLVFSFVVAVGTGLLFGMAPALQRFDAAYEVMKDQARGSTGDRSRLRSLLVTAEFALAVVLLISASLLIQSYRKLQDVQPGFTADHVLTARIWMPQPNIPSTGPYFEHPARVSLFRRSLEKIRALPGVADAGWVRRLPLTGQRGTSAFLVEGRPLESADASTVEPSMADAGYFRAMQIPLLRGRLFTDEDDQSHPPVLIISDSFAKIFFGDDDPLGKRIRPGGRTSTAPWMTVVGVVGDVKTGALDIASLPQMYRSAYQTSSLDMALVVRTQAPPGSLAVPVRRAIRELDPNLPLFNVQPMPELMSATLVQRQFSMRLLGLFALLALLLSVVGVYGVMAYTVQQRTPEIGIRVALGAARVDVLKMVLRRGLFLTGTGVLLGVGGALGLTRYLAGLLFGISPFDPFTYAVTSIALTAAAMLACYVPARRAMHVDPMIALRHE